MNVILHHTSEELLKRYKTETNPRLARRIHGAYLATKGLTCLQISTITGADRRTVQIRVRRYNHKGIEELQEGNRLSAKAFVPFLNRAVRRFGLVPLGQ